MAEVATHTRAHPVLTDRWEARAPIVLDGPLERHGWGPVLTAVLALLAGLILFQGIGTVASVFLLLTSGADLSSMMANMPALLQEKADLLLIGNAIGQILGLAVFAYVMARLHTSRPRAFLRLRLPDAGLAGLSLLGLFALMPVVMWTGTINESLPLPQWLRDFEQSQMELIDQILGSNLNVLFSLAVLAVTPAVCEELFFRGYVQRQFERGTGTATGIVLSGVIFGLYHIRLTQALPLSLLGIYLAYLAWRTGSLWIPMLVHFANNAFAVAVAEVIKRNPSVDAAQLEQMDAPWYTALLGLLVFVPLVVFIHRWAGRQRAAMSLTAADETSSKTETTI